MIISDRYRTAGHEAGHVVACRALGVRVGRVAIEAIGNRRGITEHAAAGSRARNAVLGLAGVAAETLLFGRHDPVGVEWDLSRAAALVDGDALDSPLYRRTLLMLAARSAELERIADALFGANELTGDELEALLAGAG